MTDIDRSDELREWYAEDNIDGAELLDDIEHFLRRFVAFPSAHCFVALVLWIAHTWAMAAWYVTPRLVLDSPEPGSGKTRVLEILALLCQGAKLMLSTTTAALYRRIEAAGDQPPTILADEADAVFSAKTPQSEDLRALYNSGYKRGATTPALQHFPQPKPTVPVKEAARRLSLCERHTRRRAEEFGGKRIGPRRQWLLDADLIDEYLEGHA